MGGFEANVSILFTRVPLVERFAEAARCGFQAVEFWWPRAELAAGLSINSLVDAVRDADLEVELMNFDGGDFAAGDRGLAGEPARSMDFRANVPLALDVAERLGCRKLNALAGKTQPGIARSEQLALLIENVRHAGDLAAARGQSVMVEALNAAENPSYLLTDTAAALSVIDRVGMPNVYFQLDVYHVAMAGEDPVDAIARAGSRIGHVQFADMPGRHEPGTGSLQWAPIIRSLHEVGYEGRIGLEYVATEPANPDLAYLNGLRDLSSSLTSA
jgi:hydroxypyruvate isomerase